MSIFRAQHYNVLAKEIRELWPDYKAESELEIDDGKQQVLSHLVLNLCKRFATDNPAFNNVRFTEAAIPKEIRDNIVKDATNVGD